MDTRPSWPDLAGAVCHPFGQRAATAWEGQEDEDPVQTLVDASWQRRRERRRGIGRDPIATDARVAESQRRGLWRHGGGCPGRKRRRHRHRAAFGYFLPALAEYPVPGNRRREACPVTATRMGGRRTGAAGIL